jgi:hypothetical protein
MSKRKKSHEPDIDQPEDSRELVRDIPRTLGYDPKPAKLRRGGGNSNGRDDADDLSTAELLKRVPR